jgi:hypothetical protein
MLILFYGNYQYVVSSNDKGHFFFYKDKGHFGWEEKIIFYDQQVHNFRLVTTK